MTTVIQSAFAACPDGPFTAAHKILAWPGQGIYDGDKTGQFFSIMKTGGPHGEACVRMAYGAGLFGMGNQFYHVLVGHPVTAVSVEWDWMFEGAATSGNGKSFDFVGACQQGHNGGKLSPAIQWGNISGPNGGLRAMDWWQTNPKDTTEATIKQCNAVLQDQRSGIANNELIQPPVYFGTCKPGEWHHNKMTMRGGKGGFYQTEYDHKIVQHYTGDMRNTAIGDSVNIDFAFFSGGGSKLDAPRWTGYARQANVVITVS